MIETVDFENTPSSTNQIPNSKKKFIKIPEERFNTFSHLLGGIFAIIGTILLLIHSKGDPSSVIVSIIYGGSNILLFFTSAICHSQKLHEDYQGLWSTLDQAAIYLMIAGTYTPIVYMYLSDGWRFGLLIGQWSFAILGIGVKFANPHATRWITATIYLIQGWMLIPAIGKLFSVLNTPLFWLIIGGGMFYSIGAVFYMTKKPRLWPGKFGAHELWHIFVLLGAITFFIVIYHSI